MVLLRYDGSAVSRLKPFRGLWVIGATDKGGAVAPQPSGLDARAVFKLLWVGLAGCGYVWRGTEHQWYRNLDGSMNAWLTHYASPWEADGD